ncbi:MAG TPA: 30S ribosomal protein S3 [Longimicrobium sp.]
MGQKTHPRGFRLGIVAPWKSRWYAERNFPALLVEDETIRKYLNQRLGHASIAEIEIERKPGKVVVTVHTARPGVVIGKGGSEVDKLRDELGRLSPGNEVAINVEEIKRPEISAQLTADSIAHQIVQRVSFRRAMKRAVQNAMRSGAEGIKVQVAGRLNGAEIARTEMYKEGRIPLQTMRADIDFAYGTARTTYGTIGVKVWVFKGEVVESRRSGRTYSTDA